MSAVAIQPGVWVALTRGYPDDSLFTLDGWEIAGLVTLSGLMAVVLFKIVLYKSRGLGLLLTRLDPQFTRYRLRLPLDMVTTILVCLVAIWFAPQIHYTYYRVIIDSLPMQWVFGGGFDVEQLLRLVVLRADGSIAEHTTGVVIWACVLCHVLENERSR